MAEWLSHEIQLMCASVFSDIANRLSVSMEEFQ